MLRRFYFVFLAFALSLTLTGCPGEDDSLGDQIEEGMEEVGDEVDDAL